MVMGVVNTGRGFIRDEKRRGSITGRRSTSQTGTSTPSSLTTTQPFRPPTASLLYAPSSQPAPPFAQPTVQSAGVMVQKPEEEMEEEEAKRQRDGSTRGIGGSWSPRGCVASGRREQTSHTNHSVSATRTTYVAMVMQRQAEIEQQLFTTSSTFFYCQHQPQHHRGEERRGEHESDDETDTSVSEISGYASSPMGKEEKQKRAKELREAMASSLLCCRHSNASLPSQPHETETLSTHSPPLPQHQARQPTRVRTQSCGAKRPMVGQGQQGEEEKRRKVEEDEDVKMVVEEAVDNGVILSPSESAKASVSAAAQGGQMSASVPDLSKAHAQNPTPVFGMVVRTSESHPIIVSPFFPSELLDILSRNVLGQVEEGRG
ncbi:hypothetical protein L198_07348 [Cryptococcus wingfieldii CBS 7118]|uniref:Uncharacterized protein n=1 Tax=Cryptococcus wingfieldii CBS 7118 TaxID=1295528 RepID=A0A1E3ICL5_9TREE|nr:hypothetical protein L198_07348 [Cryptococcus wingfieldii CBS 7118]ODN86329.1 hypothetical protein L198_07348 [Cryptococcus wingfieldii CBS 7118]